MLHPIKVIYLFQKQVKKKAWGVSLPLPSLALFFSESCSKLFSLWLGMTFKMLSVNIFSTTTRLHFSCETLDICFYGLSQRPSGNLKIVRYWIMTKEWCKLLNAYPNRFEELDVSRSNSQYHLWLVVLSKYLKIFFSENALETFKKKSTAAILFYFLSSLSAQHSNYYILLEQRKIKNMDTHNQWHCIHVHN